MVNLPGLKTCLVNLKVGGTNPPVSNTFTMMLYGILQHLLFPRDGLHLFAERTKFRVPNFSTFRRFPPNAQNSWREPGAKLKLNFWWHFYNQSDFFRLQSKHELGTPCVCAYTGYRHDSVQVNQLSQLS